MINDKLRTKYFVVKLWVSNVYSMIDWLIDEWTEEQQQLIEQLINKL